MELFRYKNKIRINNTIEFREKLIIFTFLFVSLFSSILLNDNIIALKLNNKGGNISIFNNNQISTCKYTGAHPNEISINGERQDEVKSQYFFNETINYTVILKWGSNIITTSCLFSNCINIT